MASTIISAKYPPNIDPTRTPLAYGDRAIPRLNRELNDENLIVRQRAVMSLCDHLHDPEHIAEALRNGIGVSLKNLLKDDDITVRQKATECLFVMAGHALGRDSFLENETIYPVARLFDDSEDIARKNAHLCVMRISETPPGAEGIVQAQFVQVLVKKLQTELNEIKELILDTLHFCMRVDTQSALDASAMEAFTSLLKHELPVIRAKAARDIMDLSVPLAGKDRAVACGALPLLRDMLKDPTMEVRANSAGAIMTITITTKGKYTAIHAVSIPPLVDLVDDVNSEVRLNAIKALTCLSEAPEGRQELLKHVDKIRKHETDHIPAVGKAAEIAVKVITWLP
ncbi:radial spoke head 14 homolog [Aplysia californica]|uniref:Radial spoke head 14 homolog n=1 Tax=Aplysia californica TaxID=6500 RepID=A0ABM0JMN2_APLCA|nr:radial spoke head 14 homolog [Aplysia californica]